MKELQPTGPRISTGKEITDPVTAVIPVNARMMQDILRTAGSFQIPMRESVRGIPPAAVSISHGHQQDVKVKTPFRHQVPTAGDPLRMTMHG